MVTLNISLYREAKHSYKKDATQVSAGVNLSYHFLVGATSYRGIAYLNLERKIV